MSKDHETNEHDASVEFWKSGKSHTSFGDCLWWLIFFLFIAYVVECKGCGMANQWNKANASCPCCQQCDHTCHPPVVEIGEIVE